MNEEGKSNTTTTTTTTAVDATTPTLVHAHAERQQVAAALNKKLNKTKRQQITKHKTKKRHKITTKTT